MEIKKLLLFYATLTTIVFLAIFTTPVCAVSENSRNTFSFRFEDCTVSDALREVSEKSGVAISANGPLKKAISRKYYVNRSLDSIIADLLRGENCALVWNYSDGDLYSIDLYTFDENDLKRTGGGSTAINRTDTYSGSRNISRAGTSYSRNRNTNNRNRSNRSLPASRTPVVIEPSKRINANRSTVFGGSVRTNTGNNSVSGSSEVSANIRRAAINKQNNNTQDNTYEEEKVINPGPSLEPPKPEKGSGLERPPMPPGF